MTPHPQIEQKKVISLVTVLAYFFLAIGMFALLYEVRSLLPPLLVSTFFAMTLINEVDRMERSGWRRGLAICVIYLLFLLLIIIGVWAINLLASGELAGVLTSVIPPELLKGDVAEITKTTTHWMTLHHIPSAMRQSILSEARHIPEWRARGIQWAATSYLPEFAANAIWVVIIPVMTFFILLDFHKILGKIFVLVPIERRAGLLTVVTDIIAVIGNYVRGMLIVMALDIGVIYIVLRLAHLPEFALPLALMAGILYTIPYFGAVISTLVIGLTALVKLGVTGALVVTGVMIFIHQVVFDNIVGPRIIGKNVNMHPLLTLLALMAGGLLFGIGGTLLAVPVAASLQVVLVHLFPQLRTDERSMLTAEQLVKTTLSTESEEIRAATRKPHALTKARRERRQAVKEAKEETSGVLPPETPPNSPT